MRTGLFGGTFNPVHTAHLIIAEWIRSELDLDSIHFVPTANPPLKKTNPSIVDIALRKEMVRLAIKDNPHFYLTDYETDTDTISYSVDTVRRFIADHSVDRKDLYFIIGEDNLKILPEWKDAGEISRLCRIVVARRSSVTVLEVPDGIEQPLLLMTPKIELSASDIRRRISKNLSVRYMVPAAVGQFIRERKLYEDYNE